MGLGDLFENLMNFLLLLDNWIRPLFTFNLELPSILVTALNGFLDNIHLGSFIEIPLTLNMFSILTSIGIGVFILINFIKLIKVL